MSRVDDAVLWSPICEQLGIRYPIFGFAHDIATVAAITNAGGYGVYGATRRFPEEITAELAEIRERVGDKPFGVDLVLPPGMPEHNSREAIEAEIPEEHKRDVPDNGGERHKTIHMVGGLIVQRTLGFKGPFRALGHIRKRSNNFFIPETKGERG